MSFEIRRKVRRWKGYRYIHKDCVRESGEASVLEGVRVLATTSTLHQQAGCGIMLSLRVILGTSGFTAVASVVASTPFPGLMCQTSDFGLRARCGIVR